MSTGATDIHVLMLLASLPPGRAGGAEIQGLALASELQAQGVQVSILTPGKDSPKGAVPGIPVYRLHSWPARIFAFLSRVKPRTEKKTAPVALDESRDAVAQISGKIRWTQVLFYQIFFWHAVLFLIPRQKKFTCIHAHTMEWSALVASRLGARFGLPVLVKESTLNGFKSLSRFPRGHFRQRLLKETSHFVAMTRAIRANLLAENIPADRIHDIPNGIRILDYPARAAKTEEIVLFVGNLYQQPAKGVDLLLMAWAEVVVRHPRAVLLLIGDGATSEWTEWLRRQSLDQSVRLLGKQSGLARHYLEATVFVLPSRREGMSNALMEAMMFGLPCVATDISGSQDLIRNEENGLLVPAADVQALAGAIRRVLDHPQWASEMGKKAAETIRGSYDIRRIAEAYVKLYHQIISPAGAS
jgi:glycosyltransferase involved in cell wall biosynthesis